MQRLVSGAFAGFVATVPMTIFMRSVYRYLPPTQQYPLPPEQITARSARVVGVEARPQEPGWEWKTWAGHFAYGSAVGAIYALLTSRSARVRTRVIARGSTYGLAVWAVSYLGWLPAAGILPPATSEPRRRNAVMIAAHLIWGGVMALMLEMDADPRSKRAAFGQKKLKIRARGPVSATAAVLRQRRWHFARHSGH